MFNQTLVAAFALTLLMLSGCGTTSDAPREDAAEAANAPDVPDAPMVFYEFYLYRMCEALDCYATIERRADTAAHSSPLSAVSEVVDRKVTTIDGLMDKLRNEIPGITVTRSTVNPAVIHLIEKGLTQDRAYVMEQQVTLSYTGTLRGLVIELGQRLPGIGPRTGGAIPIQPEDVMTETSIDVSEEIVRNVLMEAVPLEGYGRIVFEAITYGRQGSKHTEVAYSGRPLDPSLEDWP